MTCSPWKGYLPMRNSFAATKVSVTAWIGRLKPAKTPVHSANGWRARKTGATTLGLFTAIFTGFSPAAARTRPEEHSITWTKAAC